MNRKYRLYKNGAHNDVALEDLGGDRYAVTLDGQTYQVSVREIRPGLILLLRDDGATMEVPYYRQGAEVHMLVGSNGFSFEVYDEMQAVLRERRQGAASGSGVLKVQMPGRVIQVLVSEGSSVEAGQGVVVVEAMKMENEFKAPIAGIVKSVHVEVGQVVDSGDTLLVIEASA